MNQKIQEKIQKLEKNYLTFDLEQGLFLNLLSTLSIFLTPCMKLLL
jgi:hypothetical protein